MKAFLKRFIVSVISLCMLFSAMGVGAAEVSSFGYASDGIMKILNSIAPLSVATGDAKMRMAYMNNSTALSSTVQDYFLVPNGSGTDGDGHYAALYYTSPYDNSISSSSQNASCPAGHIIYCIEMNTPLLGSSTETVSGKFTDTSYLKNMKTPSISTEGKVFEMVSLVLSVANADVGGFTYTDVLNNAANASKNCAVQWLLWQITNGDLDENWNRVGTRTDQHAGYEHMKAWNTDVPGGKSVKYWYDKYMAAAKALNNGGKVYEAAVIKTVSDDNGKARQTMAILSGKEIVVGPKVGTVVLTKGSSNTAVTNGNSSYDYNGVQFRLVDKATNGKNYNKVGTVVNGKITWTDVPEGDYIITEVSS